MPEYSEQDTETSSDLLTYTGKLVQVEVARLNDETTPSNQRRILRRFEQYEIKNTETRGCKIDHNMTEWVDQQTAKAQNRDTFADIGQEAFDEFSERIGSPPPVERTDCEGSLRSCDNPDEARISTSDLRARLNAHGTSSEKRQQLVFVTELTTFSDEERDALLPVLWQYIQEYRDSNDSDELVAVGTAIRKYIALMPMDQMDKLVELLEPGHRAELPLELELEVAKMIYRNFEVHPPQQPNPHPELGTCLWAMAKDYINPRFLLRDKHATVATLAIEALVAMQSVHSREAWLSAINSPYEWFGELVDDNLKELRQKWALEANDAVAWLDSLRASVSAYI